MVLLPAWFRHGDFLLGPQRDLVFWFPRFGFIVAARRTKIKTFFLKFPLRPLDYSGSITVVVEKGAGMSEEKSWRLGDLQLRIMKVLWDGGPATVARVHEVLSAEEEIAYNTVATMLRKMEGRGMVSHHNELRKFVYVAAITESEVTRSMTSDLVDRLFSGSLAGMVSHLLEHREVSAEELRVLKQLIQERTKKP